MNKVEESIINSINKNGFPEKRVTLPFQAIFNSCKKHEVKLADVLKNLEEKQILSEIGNEKILFYSFEHVLNEAEQSSDSSDGGSNSLFKTAMDKIKQMNPGQLNELRKKVANMSADERAELMKKAKDMFTKKN